MLRSLVGSEMCIRDRYSVTYFSCNEMKNILQNSLTSRTDLPYGVIYSLPKILQTNENLRGAQTLLTSSLLIGNSNFVSYRRNDVCISALFQFTNNFGNWCLLAIFHIYVTLLGNCVKYSVVLACVKQLFTALHYATRTYSRLSVPQTRAL